MNRSNEQATHSGIAQFSDYSARDRFVRSTLDQNPGLKGCAFLPETRPTIIFENLTPAQHNRVKQALKGQGRWFDDVQFRTMS
jgi:hypothetical protein